PGLLASLSDVEPEHAGLLDRAVVPALGLTVGAQRIQLARDVGGGEEVAGVGVAGDQAEGPALSHPPDQDRRVGPRQALGRVERPPQREVAAGVWPLVTPGPGPHPEADLERFLEDVEPLPNSGKGDPQRLGLRTASSPDAEAGSAARE